MSIPGNVPLELCSEYVRNVLLWKGPRVCKHNIILLSILLFPHYVQVLSATSVFFAEKLMPCYALLTRGSTATKLIFDESDDKNSSEKELRSS